MEKTKDKVLVGLLLGVIIAGILFVLVLARRHRETEVYRIGAILPLTGSASEIAQQHKMGIDFAKDRINEQGGIKGKRLEVIYEDDRNDPKQTVSAFNKLVDVDKVPVVFTVMSSSSMAVYPLAEKKRVVLFANCGHPEITELSDWVFRNFPTGKQEAHKMVKFAYDELGIRTISVLFINDAFGEGAMKVIKEEFEKRGGKILRTEAFEKDNVDFRSLIGRVLQSQPQAIYIYGYGNANGLVVKQTRELGYEKYVLGSYNFSIEPTLGIAKEALEGSYFTSPMFDSNSPAAEIERFVNDFKQKYGVPPLWNTVYEYDAIQVLAKVIGQGSFSGESIRSNLKNVGDFNGFAGKYFALPYGEWESELTVKTFRNGRQVVVAK